MFQRCFWYLWVYFTNQHLVRHIRISEWRRYVQTLRRLVKKVCEFLDYFFCSLCIWPLVITLTTRLPYFVVNGTHEGNYLTAFSMYSNAKKLFTFPRSPEEEIGLKCISGMKVVSMLWIIFGHRALVNIFSPNINSKFILEVIITVFNNIHI